MREKIKMLENHTHFLAQAVHIQLDSLSLVIFIFFLSQIHPVKKDGSSCRLLQKIQTSEEGGLSGTGRTNDCNHITLIDINCHSVQSLNGAALIPFF